MKLPLYIITQFIDSVDSVEWYEALHVYRNYHFGITHNYIMKVTGSSSTCPLWYHYPVHIKKNSYFVVIKPWIKKELFNIYGVCKKYYLE